jgi:hypothetical protein
MEKKSMPLSETRSLAVILIMRKKMIAFATKKAKNIKFVIICCCNILFSQILWRILQ